MTVQGRGGCDNRLDLSLGNAWLLAIVIILQSSCYFTVLAHLLPDPAGMRVCKGPFLTALWEESRVQFICQVGLVRPPSHSHALPGSSTAVSAWLSITHLLSSVASHTRLADLLCPHSQPFFLLTSAFCKPSPTLVLKWLYCFIPGSFPPPRLGSLAFP